MIFVRLYSLYGGAFIAAASQSSDRRPVVEW